MDSLAIGRLAYREQCEDQGTERVRECEPEQQEAAFISLVERQGRFLYRVAYAALRNSHDAEDVVQEAFLKLYRTGAWLGMQEERAYLARVVWRIAGERASRREMEPFSEADSEALVADGASPEESVVRSGEAVRLRRMIDALPGELRQPLLLSAVEEMTSREIGVAMGIPEGTVRTRLMRAREELRRRFRKEARL